MSPEELTRLIQVTVERALATIRSVPTTSSGGGSGARLDERFFRRVEKVESPFFCCTKSIKLSEPEQGLVYSFYLGIILYRHFAN